VADERFALLDGQILLELWAYWTLEDTLRVRPLTEAEGEIWSYLRGRADRRISLLEERFGRPERRSGNERRLRAPNLVPPERYPDL